jgi:hypothetical protein
MGTTALMQLISTDNQRDLYSTGPFRLSNYVDKEA